MITRTWSKTYRDAVGNTGRGSHCGGCGLQEPLLLFQQNGGVVDELFGGAEGVRDIGREGLIAWSGRGDELNATPHRCGGRGACTVTRS